MKNLSLLSTKKLIKGQIYSNKFLNITKYRKNQKNFGNFKKSSEKMTLRVNIDMSKIMQMAMIVNICRAWHDVWAIAHARTVTHANKKKEAWAGDKKPAQT